MWARYHSSLLACLQSEILPGALIATVSRHVTSRLITMQYQDDKVKLMDTVSISDYDIDIVEYTAGFVLHRIRQKAQRLQSGVEKTATLELIGAMIRNAEDAKSALIKCPQRSLLSVISDLPPIFKRLEIIATEIALQDLVTTKLNDIHVYSYYYYY